MLALKKMADSASPATRERIALCFRRLATEPLNRGLVVQQGGLVRITTSSARVEERCEAAMWARFDDKASLF